MEKDEGVRVSTNPFVAVQCSTPKKKVKLKPKNLVFSSAESSLLSPSYVTVASPVSAAVNSAAGPCGHDGGNGGEQNPLLLHSRGLLQPAGDFITPVVPCATLPSTSTNPFLSVCSNVPAGTVATSGVIGNVGSMEGPSGLPTSDSGAGSQPGECFISPVVSSTPLLSTPVKPFLGGDVGRLACSASVPVRQSAQAYPRSSFQSLGRRPRPMQVVKD